MIVEPVPTNPRSPARRLLRVMGIAAPALLLLGAVAVGVVGPRPEPPPTAPPAATADPVALASLPAASVAPGPPDHPGVVPWAAKARPPASFAGFEVGTVAEVVAARSAGATLGLVAVDGWLGVESGNSACASTSWGALGPWCRRSAILAAKPWTGVRAGISAGLPAHLHVAIPLGVRLPDGLTPLADGGTPVRVLALGHFDHDGSPCGGRGPGACDGGFVVDRITWAGGSRMGLTTLLAPGLDATRRANPLEAVAMPDVPLLAVYARPAVLLAIDPAIARLGHATLQQPATWYVRWFDATSREVRWQLLDGRTLGVLGAGRMGGGIADAEIAPVQAR